MAKLTLSNVTNISGAESVALGVINANSDAIETALEKTLSRDGTTPNSMGADLDMDNNDILNVDNIDVNTLTIDGVPVVAEEIFTLDPELLALSGLMSAADKVPYFTGSGTAATADFTSIGRAIVASSSVADVRNQLDTPVYVATRTALKAIDTTKDTTAILTESGREGTFIWRSGDYSAQITADTAEGVFVKATAIASASGAWVRLAGWAVSGALVQWFGAVGGGTDDTAAFQAACTFISNQGGGTVRFSDRHLINSNLTVGERVLLKGPLPTPGELLPGASADYDGKIGTLLVNSAATITVGDGSMVTNCVIVRSGLNLPFADATAATAGVAAFAGTAITVAGADAGGQDLLVLGFAKALLSDGYERVRCDRISGDCTSGIQVSNCADISYITRCHFWPFTTAHYGWMTSALLNRTGIAYLISNVGDWNKITDCFSYGYFRGFDVVNVQNATLKGCGADGTGTVSGAIGFLIDGTSDDVQLIACQAGAQEHGFYLNNTANLYTQLLGCSSWSNMANGVYIASGDAHINGGNLENQQRGINVANAGSHVFIDNVRFKNHSGSSIHAGVANSNVIIGKNNDFSDVAAGTSPVGGGAPPTLKTIASATALLLPANGSIFLVSGTTTITSVSGLWAGREVTLIFQGALTFTDGSNLKLAGNFVTTADDTISLVSDGVNWFETSRSVN